MVPVCGDRKTKQRRFASGIRVLLSGPTSMHSRLAGSSGSGVFDVAGQLVRLRTGSVYLLDQTVEHPYTVPPVQECLRKMATDKSGSAGNQNGFRH